MNSMNSGKGMAQAAHAANAFTHRVTKLSYVGKLHNPISIGYENWSNQTEQGFGTTITLEVCSEEEMLNICEQSRQVGFLAEAVHDPGYPVRDGRVTHSVSVNTCAFVFAHDHTNLPPVLTGLKLHP
jgi:peptidyl-tRNA hydrolase